MENNELSKNFELKTGINFNTFYNGYRNKLIWHLTKYTKDQDISQDFVDDAFTQALVKIDNFDNDKSQIHTWVYKIAENLVKKDFKDRNRLSLVSMDKENDDETHLTISGMLSDEDDNNKVETDLILIKKAKIVKDTIMSLPEKYKTVMVMRELQKKSYTDIAESCVKIQEINTTSNLKLDSPSDILDLELINNGVKNCYVNITYVDYKNKSTIQFEIEPKKSFLLTKDDIENVIDIELLTDENLVGTYRTTTNLSTIKSQISKGRQLIQSMVSNKFKNLDEHGIF